MADFILAGILVVIIGAAVIYIVKAKKRGVKCIGCPAGGNCSGKCNSTGGCNGTEGVDCHCNCHSEDSQ